MIGDHAMRDGENEAFIVDRYLDSLLTRRPVEATGLAPELRATAQALVAELPRYHPSFRFEERLAARLAAAAGPDAGHEAAGEIILFPQAVVTVRDPDGHPSTFRPAVLGGVLTSAAISLAGAAFVAWRRSRAPADPMARAIREAARRRTA